MHLKDDNDCDGSPESGCDGYCQDEEDYFYDDDEIVGYCDVDNCEVCGGPLDDED